MVVGYHGPWLCMVAIAIMCMAACMLNQICRPGHAGLHHGAAPAGPVERSCAGLPQGHGRGPVPGPDAKLSIENTGFFVLKRAARLAAPRLPTTAGCEKVSVKGDSSVVVVGGRALDPDTTSPFPILESKSTAWLYRIAVRRYLLAGGQLALLPCMCV